MNRSEWARQPKKKDHFLLLLLVRPFETNNGKKNRVGRLFNKKHTTKVCFLLSLAESCLGRKIVGLNAFLSKMDRILAIWLAFTIG
jgi:hypothetical protein